MSQKHFDFAIVGAGAAGLHLSMAFIKDPFFENKKILLIEKDPKDQNDRTWCFWETDGRWDEIATKVWRKGDFLSSKGEVQFKTEPYAYKMVRSIDFYKYALNQVKAAANFTLINEDVETIEGSENSVTIKTEQSEYSVGHVFDSRIDQDVEGNNYKYLNVLQHFKGWLIETKDPVFDPDRFVMMDYRVKWNKTTSFMYTLPVSENEALVEFTFFTPDLVEEDIYDEAIKKYLEKEFGNIEYSIKETEKGIIPMSNYPFHRLHSNRVTKIGTAGGWVRPSTGYSFKNGERYSKMILENIKNKKQPAKGVAQNRFRKYDTLFLELLQSKNEMGEDLFYTMYRKNKIDQIFKFLDEQTTFVEELRIMNSFNPIPFMGAILKNFRFLLTS